MNISADPFEWWLAIVDCVMVVGLLIAQVAVLHFKVKPDFWEDL